MYMRRLLVLSLCIMSCVTVFSQAMETLDVKTEPDGSYEHTVGSILVKGHVLNGLKNETWVENHPSVDLPHFIVQYKEGKKDGLYIELDKSGYIVKKEEYKDGKLHGESCQWFRSGRLSKKQEYKNGKLDGKSIICYDKGFIQEESEYKDGKRNGVTIWYSYADKGQGPKAAMYTYKDGVFEGIQEIYYDDESLKSTKMFSNNVANGPAIEFYEDGSIKSECVYKNGEISGKVKEYERGNKFVK